MKVNDKVKVINLLPEDVMYQLERIGYTGKVWPPEKPKEEEDEISQLQRNSDDKKRNKKTRKKT
jgi:hypothetical protein